MSCAQPLSCATERAGEAVTKGAIVKRKYAAVKHKKRATPRFAIQTASSSARRLLPLSAPPPRPSAHVPPAPVVAPVAPVAPVTTMALALLERDVIYDAVVVGLGPLLVPLARRERLNVAAVTAPAGAAAGVAAAIVREAVANAWHDGGTHVRPRAHSCDCHTLPRPAHTPTARTGMVVADAAV